MERSLLDLRVAGIIQHLQKSYASFDLDAIFDSGSEFDSRIKEYFTTFFIAFKDAEDAREVINEIDVQPLFKVDVDVNDMLYEWSGDLVATLKDPDAYQLANDYLAKFNPQIFHLYSNNVSLRHLGLLWGLSEGLGIESARFMALLMFYLLTKAFTAEMTRFDDKLKSVEAFFYVRDYLVNDGDYPVHFIEDQFETLELKSLMTHNELHVVSQIKALTAAGGVAASIQREDLEGRKKKKDENDEKDETSKKKKYNRIEKLEDDD